MGLNLFGDFTYKISLYILPFLVEMWEAGLRVQGDPTAGCIYVAHDILVKNRLKTSQRLFFEICCFKVGLSVTHHTIYQQDHLPPPKEKE